jgi:cytochrome P450
MDLEQFCQHYDVNSETLLQNREQGLEHLLAHCPVAHSDVDGGFWVVSRYRDVLGLLRDPSTFSSTRRGRVPSVPASSLTYLGGPIEMIPINVDPPIQREYRRLMNPYLTPQAIGGFEPAVTRIVDDLIDDFIEDGHCDLIGQLARPFPGRMLFSVLLGADPDEVAQVQAWAFKVVYGPFDEKLPAAEAAWIDWLFALITSRRKAERQNDLIDGLLHGTVEGRALTDDEVMRALLIVLLGGFGTTMDTTGNIVRRLAEDPDLQDHVRANLAEFPAMVDEFLRIDPPVTGLSRLTTTDTEIGGCPIPAGSRVYWSMAAANRDPEEFERPGEFALDRKQNRHLSFGAGPHRCIGSNVARLNLRVVMERILTRMHDIRITPGDTYRYSAKLTYGPDHLPVTFRAA